MVLFVSFCGILGFVPTKHGFMVSADILHRGYRTGYVLDRLFVIRSGEHKKN